MPFLKRLGFYLVGLAIGLIFLTFFLKKKSEETGTEFCYLPNCRVLQDLRSKPLKYSDAVAAKLDAAQLDSLGIAYFLTEGDVDFGRSDTKAKPCKTYWVAAQLEDKNGALQLRSCKDTVYLEELVLE